ncbi:MAG: sce7726 family protein [Bacteroidales bacterium]|nr:sce7726 family protein [Bacteroidales bacterium]
MNTFNSDSNSDKWRSYASIFSSGNFIKLLRKNDFSFLDLKIKRLDQEFLENGIFSYLDYVKYTYKQLEKSYRNEYVFKNTVINKLLIQEYGTKDTIAINEFNAGNSVADLVIFNGNSKVFEIKSKFDSKKRIDGQISNYQKLFNECYVVVEHKHLSRYISLPSQIGIFTMQLERGRLVLHKERDAIENRKIDPYLVMRSVKTQEYKNIVREYLGYLPEMNAFNMFSICDAVITQIPPEHLNQLYIEEVKKRKSNTAKLKKFNSALRQICLSLKLTEQQYLALENSLSISIKK